jgi:hypothetical protein
MGTMKTQKTIIAALTRQIQFVIQKAKFPIVVSVKRPQQEVSFEGFRNIEKCLSSVAAVKINPQPIKLNVKVKNKIQTGHVNFDGMFEIQSELFREILESKKDEILEQANNQWNNRNNFNN